MRSSTKVIPSEKQHSFATIFAEATHLLSAGNLSSEDQIMLKHLVPLNNQHVFLNQVNEMRDLMARGAGAVPVLKMARDERRKLDAAAQRKAKPHISQVEDHFSRKMKRAAGYGTRASRGVRNARVRMAPLKREAGGRGRCDAQVRRTKEAAREKKEGHPVLEAGFRAAVEKKRKAEREAHQQAMLEAQQRTADEARRAAIFRAQQQAAIDGERQATFNAQREAAFRAHRQAQQEEMARARREEAMRREQEAERERARLRRAALRREQEAEMERARRRAEELCREREAEMERVQRQAEEFLREHEAKMERARRHEEEMRREREAEMERGREAARNAQMEAEIEFLKVYDFKWEHIKTKSSSIPLIYAQEVPWPVLFPLQSLEQIVVQNVAPFFLHPGRVGLQGKTQREILKAEMLRWHPDKFNNTVLSKIPEVDVELARDAAGRVARILTQMMEGL